MTTRRLPHTPAAPSLTGGEDRPRARCAEDFAAFDVLHHKTCGDKYDYAKAEILSERLCGGCPLRQGCWDDAHATDAPWFLSLRGKPVPPHAGRAA